MITETLLDVIWRLIKPLLDLLPSMELNIPIGTFDIFIDGLQAVCYLLPMTQIIIMVDIVVAITIFRIIVSLIKTIWELLPLV